MTVTVALRENQSTDLTWGQIDGNFSALASAVNSVITQSGTSLNRPVPSYIGQPYFDTTLGFQINAKQLSPIIWVAASGVSV